MLRNLLVVFFCIFFLMLCSCGGEREIHSAAEVMDSYYGSLRADRAEDAVSLFTEDFAQKNPRESWLETVGGITAKMGPLVEWKRSTANSHYYTNISGDAETVLVIYSVRYAKHSSREVFTLVKDPLTGKYRICGIDITREE
ncbi:MAG: hypothetical protein ACRCUT_07035 [Spirochaetota bacterium]